MAALTKFNVFTSNLAKGSEALPTAAYKLMLTDTAPVATNAVKGDITEIAAGNGYTAGGAAIALSLTSSGAVTTVNAASTTFTASGGAIAQFRYVVLYNSTTGALVAWGDIGAEVNLASGSSEAFTFPTGALTIS